MRQDESKPCRDYNSSLRFWMVGKRFLENGPEVAHVVPERHWSAVIDDKCLASDIRVVQPFGGEDVSIGDIAHICSVEEIRVVSELYVG